MSNADIKWVEESKEVKMLRTLSIEFIVSHDGYSSYSTFGSVKELPDLESDSVVYSILLDTLSSYIGLDVDSASLSDEEEEMQVSVRLYKSSDGDIARIYMYDDADADYFNAELIIYRNSDTVMFKTGDYDSDYQFYNVDGISGEFDAIPSAILGLVKYYQEQ